MGNRTGRIPVIFFQSVDQLNMSHHNRQFLIRAAPGDPTQLSLNFESIHRFRAFIRTTASNALTVSLRRGVERLTGQDILVKLNIE